MRKIVISLITCLLLVGTIYFIVQGNDMLQVQGILGINEKNKEIDRSITDLSNIISITYVSTDANLRRTANLLTETKTEYENQSALATINNSGYASGKEAYDIDYLWTKLGNYAKQENVVIKIEVMVSDINVSLYNLNFTVTGDYTNITNFIYEIENDSKLGFKIDAFTMTSVNDSETGDTFLSATFECREIFMSVGEIDGSMVSTNAVVSSDNVNVKENKDTTNQNNINENTKYNSNNVSIESNNIIATENVVNN